ncbi:GNAT family N-acetyltransferase [Spirosoma sp. BT702]|uniref:Aminoglycoside N(6')-acetyltransferase type 1 n=1 Tax=Spirosoma profusum TaxID=2771354 RepID=A0A927AR41_9BACT|nr:aminoglycoside 6'-N-acetyltransferase [Spirosoma profusum]MBD2701681.1 GNAT family N-acetyltransferase [Spirosoma profusum]
MRITKINEPDFKDWQQMALALWPDTTEAEMAEVLNEIYQSPKQEAFIVRDNQGVAIGFMNLSLRVDYVPGASQTPVAFLEGIYVAPVSQQQGVGRALIRQAEEWAREQGSKELASDVLLDNTLGEAFHKGVGFEEVERTISFIKPI